MLQNGTCTPSSTPHHGSALTRSTNYQQGERSVQKKLTCKVLHLWLGAANQPSSEPGQEQVREYVPCAPPETEDSSESSNKGVTPEPLVEAEPRPLLMEPRRRRKHKAQGFKRHRRLTSSSSSFNSSRSSTSSLDGSGHRRCKRSSRRHGKCRSSIGITDTTALAHLGHAQTPLLYPVSPLQ